MEFKESQGREPREGRRKRRGGLVRQEEIQRDGWLSWKGGIHQRVERIGRKWCMDKDCTDRARHDGDNDGDGDNGDNDVDGTTVTMMVDDERWWWRRRR